MLKKDHDTNKSEVILNTFKHNCVLLWIGT